MLDSTLWLTALSFVDVDGLRHSVEVDAESPYEAVALAIHTFRQHDCEPGPGSKIEVEVRAPSVIHTTTTQTIYSWLEESGRSPKEILLKHRLKELIGR